MRGKGIRYIAAMQQLRTKGKRITSRRRCRSLLPCYAGVGMGTGTTDWNLEGTNGTDDAGKKCGASRSRPQPDPATYYLRTAARSARRRRSRGATRWFPPEAASLPSARPRGALLVALAPPGGGRDVAPPLPARDRRVVRRRAAVVRAYGVSTCRAVVCVLPCAVARRVHPCGAAVASPLG